MCNDEIYPQDLQADYHDLTHGAGIVRLRFQIVSFHGRDRAKFLHNFCTANIKALQSGEGSEAFVLNVKGKTIAFGYVLIQNDRIYFLTAPQSSNHLIPHFEKYVITEDVQIADRTLELDCWCCQGRLDELSSDSSHGLSRDAKEMELIQRLQSMGGQPYLNHQNFKFHGHDLLIAHSAFTSNSDRMLISASADRLAFIDEFKSQAIREVSGESFEIARIEQGTPTFGIDVTDANLPQEVGRDKLAISFTKGCYLGQETVARIDALGHVNKFLVRLKFTVPTVPPAGTELSYDGKRVGKLTSVCFSPKYAAPIALAYVTRGFQNVDYLFESDFGRVTIIG